MYSITTQDMGFGFIVTADVVFVQDLYCFFFLFLPI